MSKWFPDSYLDLILEKVKASDGESICSKQPATFFNAVKGELHALSTAYVVGDVVRPPTDNGMVYECITAGTSGGVEPGWGVVQDKVFNDGTVTWKTHENYTLAYTDLEKSDLVIGDGAVNGRTLTVGKKIGVVTHRAGTVTHTAFVNSITQELTCVTTASTTISGDNDVEAGRTTIFFSMTISISDPV